MHIETSGPNLWYVFGYHIPSIILNSEFWKSKCVLILLLMTWALRACLKAQLPWGSNSLCSPHTLVLLQFQASSIFKLLNFSSNQSCSKACFEKLSLSRCNWYSRRQVEQQDCEFQLHSCVISSICTPALPSRLLPDTTNSWSAVTNTHSSSSLRATLLPTKSLSRHPESGPGDLHLLGGSLGISCSPIQKDPWIVFISPLIHNT